MKVTVVGSVNLDLVISAERLPQPGETLTNATFARHPGGKGANQALAARLLGADVTLLAAVGNDAFAGEALALLRTNEVDLNKLVIQEDSPTGVAVIVVGEGGDNQIVVAPGANRTLTGLAADLDCDLLLAQLEVPIETVLTTAGRVDAFFCLNAAPYREIPVELLQRTDLLVVNQVEYRQLGEAARSCRRYLAVTLGEEGAVLYERGVEVARARPPAVQAIDATAAGDAFTSALAMALAEGLEVDRALEFGCAAGALATTKSGAQPSLPRRWEIEEILGWARHQSDE